MPGSPIITCPECAKKFKGKGDLRGKKIRCPFCKEPFVVKAAAEEDDSERTLPPRKSPPAAGKKSAVKGAFAPPAIDDDDDDNENPYSVTELDIAPRCPNCASEMESEEAVVCLHCGYNTLTREWGKTERVFATTGGEHFLYLLPGIICAVVILLQIIGMLFYCVVLPFQVGTTFWRFTDHESMRVWTTVAGMFDIWPLGYFAFNRLVLKPKPPPKVKK